MLAGMTIGSNKLIFMYDENGSPFGFTYNGTAYYYIKNLQGDVEAIANASGTIVVRYYYDAWGNILDISGTLADTIGEANPIRYRSYYYDTDTGYYYLQSRYYDPELCRFISADTTDLLGIQYDFYDKNLFAYCDNNSVCRVDCGGEQWELALAAAGTSGVAVVGASMSFASLGASALALLGSITPVGWAFIITTIAVVMVASVVAQADTIVDNQSSPQSSCGSISTPSSPEPPNNNDDKPSLKKLTKYLIQKLGVNPHNVKYEYLGRGAEVKLYDLAYDTSTGIVYIITKAGKIVTETYYNAFGDRFLW